MLDLSNLQAAEESSSDEEVYKKRKKKPHFASEAVSKRELSTKLASQLEEDVLLQRKEESLINDVEHIEAHYHKYYKEFTVHSKDEKQCLFSVLTKGERRVKVELTVAEGYKIVEDGDQNKSLVGQKYESFEQMLAALDKSGFSDMFCGLIAEKLEQEAKGD